MAGFLPPRVPFFHRMDMAVGISTMSRQGMVGTGRAGNECAAEMNTSLVEIETLASNYDDGRMQFWQELSRRSGLCSGPRAAAPDA
jgi:hypothetical protein